MVGRRGKASTSQVLIAAIVLLALVRAMGSAPAEVGASTPPVSAQDLTFAADDYARSGLSAPVVRVREYPTLEHCDGNLGRHILRQNYSEIRLCLNGLSVTRQENVLRHEMAHAWIAQNTTPEQRREYMELRGLELWNGTSVPWNQRGTEDAAFVFQSILRTEKLPMQSPEWQSRLAGFHVLTGK